MTLPDSIPPAAQTPEQELINAVDRIASLSDHYLVNAKALDHPYFYEFLQAGAILKPFLTAKEYDSWIKEKMLLKQQAFSEKTFIQAAVETAVVRCFGERFPQEFRVEAKINGIDDKDVDCVFTDAGYTFNIEVKCSDYTEKKKVETPESVRVEIVGRMPDRGQEALAAITAALQEGLAKQGKDPMPVLVSKSMDNSLKDHLLSAHGKFAPTVSATEVNILVVGCDDARDMQRWYNYLFAEQGLFTKSSSHDFTAFENVDLVVLTNQHFKHNRFFEKQTSNSWTLDPGGFNLICQNPHRRAEKRAAIVHFLNLMPNYSEALDRFVVSGTADAAAKASVRIPHFVKEQLEDRQRYPFQRL